MLTAAAQAALDKGLQTFELLRGTGTWPEIRLGHPRPGSAYGILLVIARRLGRNQGTTVTTSWREWLVEAPFLINVMAMERAEHLAELASLRARVAELEEEIGDWNASMTGASRKP